ncbi:MAG: SRPBCC domain-containing protein [Cytophagales bacterium]|nr:SRPBCC domain-containing protein [Cytophagales bacterium]
MDDKDTISFTITRIVKAPLEEVFSALANEEQLSEYLGECTLEPQKGGKVSLFDGWVKGKVLEFMFLETLSYTWKPAEWDEKTPYSVVKYVFKDLENYTEIILTHSNFISKKEAESHKKGWEEFVFAPLEVYLGL